MTLFLTKSDDAKYANSLHWWCYYYSAIIYWKHWGGEVSSKMFKFGLSSDWGMSFHLNIQKRVSKICDYSFEMPAYIGGNDSITKLGMSHWPNGIMSSGMRNDELLIMHHSCHLSWMMVTVNCQTCLSQNRSGFQLLKHVKDVFTIHEHK